jgi:hypothetical protein
VGTLEDAQPRPSSLGLEDRRLPLASSLEVLGLEQRLVELAALASSVSTSGG